jgi:hypothetical protein
MEPDLPQPPPPGTLESTRRPDSLAASPLDDRPSPGNPAPDPQHPVFQQALEILRRELPAEQMPAGGAAQKTDLVQGPTPNPAPVEPGGEQIAEIIPARMMNEFVYCPRLFYYEFVEGVFVENADTMRGEAIHQRVDSGDGALPAARKKPKAEEKAAGNKSGEAESPSPQPSPQSGAGLYP